MIDVHCHLEQEDYMSDRDEIIAKCKEKLKAIVTVCAKQKDWPIALGIVKKHKGFVYLTAGEHPQNIKDITIKDIDEYIEKLRKAVEEGLVIGIGEVGLDYKWVKDPQLREKQKEMFERFIDLAKELNIPLIVHSWNSDEDVLNILEQKGMAGRKVLLHQFEGKRLAKRIIDNEWNVSIGPGIQRSKTRRKLARDLPLNRILLETDSPWFGGGNRGTPLNVFKAAKKIAEIKGISLEEVEKQTDLNAIELFNLNVKQ